MLDRKSLLALAAAGLTLSFLLALGARAQAPGSPPAAGAGQGFPSFFDQRRLPDAGPNLAEEAAKQLKAEEARRKAAEVEAARARALAAQAEAKRIADDQRRLAAEAEASRKAAEARRIAIEEALRRQAAEAEAKQQAEQARQAAALAAALAAARREAAEKAVENARLAAQAEAKRKADESRRAAAAAAKARSRSRIEGLRAQAEAARRETAEKRRLEQQRAIAAEAEPKISAAATQALAAKAAASRKAAEQRLISARAARAESRALANEARKRASGRKAALSAAATANSPVRPDNPALSRYQVGLDEEFDAMEAGLDEEFVSPTETAKAAAPGLASPAIKRATVGAALTSSAVAPAAIAAPLLPFALNAKDCLLVAESVEQGVLKLRLKTSADTKGTVTARINDIVHLAKTVSNGEVALSAPLLGVAGAVYWTFPGNAGCATQLRPADPSRLLQVALVWQGGAALNLHVLEPGAWMGGLYGHVWRKRPNADLEAGAGRLSLFKGGATAASMQVYAVDPRSIGRRRILNVMIDFASRGNPPRPPFCSGGAGGAGQPVKFQVHILRPAGPRGQVRREVRNFEFAPRPCGRLIPARQRYEKLSLRP